MSIEYRGEEEEQRKNDWNSNREWICVSSLLQRITTPFTQEQWVQLNPQKQNCIPNGIFTANIRIGCDE